VMPAARVPLSQRLFSSQNQLVAERRVFRRNARVEIRAFPPFPVAESVYEPSWTPYLSFAVVQARCSRWKVARHFRQTCPVQLYHAHAVVGVRSLFQTSRSAVCCINPLLLVLFGFGKVKHGSRRYPDRHTPRPGPCALAPWQLARTLARLLAAPPALFPAWCTPCPPPLPQRP
jgi:hypothetical protein